jgi:alpha-mannosidase
VVAAAGAPPQRRFGASWARLTYQLEPGARRLDMHCEIDWQEREHLLKVCLPIAVRTATARFETQYGHIERAIHENTSWDEARYESCTHRFVHVAEPGYGVGVVNDSTYGADVTRLPAPGGGTLIRLSLLRGPRFPDPDTDQGQHRMRWSVVCAPDAADTIGAAYELNAPELEAVPDVDPLVSLDLSAGLAVVDWIKLADDGSGDVVVRIFEAQGGRAAGRLRMCADLGHDAAVTETDLLERPVDSTADDLPRALHEGQLRLGPFQVATLRIQPSTPSPDVPPTRRSES